MRYLVVTDIHGKLLEKLNPVIDDGIDSLICLGDFDQVRSIRSFMDLQARLEQEGKQVITVPGNHDYAVAFCQDISSGTLRAQKKEIYQLHEELNSDELALRFIFDLFGKTNGKELRLNKDFNAYVVHGGLNGDMYSFPECPDKIRDLWYRLENEYHHRINFRAMEEKGYNVMIRGHDHERSCVSFFDGIVKNIHQRLVVLNPEILYTLNPGAWYNSNYLVIDCSKEQSFVDFRKI